MKEYDVALPIAGVIYVTVEAEDEEDAINKALQKEDLKLEDVETWDVYRMLVEGNCMHASPNEAEATEALGQ